MTLNEKIASITADIGVIRKTKKENSTVNYAFRGIDDVMNHLNPLLAKNAVSLEKEVVSFKLDEKNSTDKYGKARSSYCAIVHIRLIFTDGIEKQQFEEVAMSEDYADKAMTQAESMAYKYAILRKFCIPTEDLPDGDGREPERKPTIQTQPLPKSPLSAALAIGDWGTKIDDLRDDFDVNSLLFDIKKQYVGKSDGLQIKSALNAKAKALGLIYNTESAQYTYPITQ